MNSKIHDEELDKLDGNEISFNKLSFLKKFQSSIKKLKNYGFF